MRLQDVRITRWSVGLLGAGVLGLLLGTSGTVRAQDTRDEAHPPQQEEPKKDEAKPRPQEEQKEAKPAKVEKQDEKEMKSEKEQDHPKENVGGDHATRAAATQGRRIPDDKFRSNFGREHSFRVQKTVIVEGQPRFQYGGFWFALGSPWPGDWAYTDNCYIDFVDGEYVLIDLLHPGVQIAVLVVE